MSHRDATYAPWHHLLHHFSLLAYYDLAASSALRRRLTARSASETRRRSRIRGLCFPVQWYPRLLTLCSHLLLLLLLDKCKGHGSVVRPSRRLFGKVSV